MKPYDETYFTPRYIKLARVVLRWNQRDLAEAANIAISTVADFERGTRMPIPQNCLAIQTAIKKAGIEFIHQGIMWDAKLEKWGR